VNYQDWYIDENSAVKPSQGSQSYPARNQFSPRPNHVVDESHIKHGLGASKIDYYFSYTSAPTTQPNNSSGSKVDIFSVGGIFSRDQDCSSNYGTSSDGEGGIILADLQNGYTEIMQLVSQIHLLETNYSNILNGGIGPVLMDALLDGDETSQDIRDVLISESPYLSDDILIGAINREIPMSQWHLTEVLVWNSRLSRQVLNALYEVQPLTPYQYNLVLNADQGSQRLLLEMDINDKRVRLEHLKSQYISNARRCVDANIYTELIKIYDINNDAFSTAQCIDAELKQNHYSQAKSRLSQYMANNSKHHVFEDYYTLAIDLQESGRNWFQMTESESRNIDVLENSTDKLIAKKAESINRLINDNPRVMSNLPIHSSSTQAKQAYVGKPSDEETFENLMEVNYLSDSKTLVFVNTNNILTYSIINALGQIVDQGEINNEVETKDVSHLPQGLYHIQMVSEHKNNSCYEKFIVE